MSQPTYTMQGADGQTYGPSSLAEIQTWIREGRIARETQMSRSDVEGWFRAGDFQELTWPANAATTAAPAGSPVAAGATPVFTASRPATSLDEADPGLLAQMRAHASWFWWIAGFQMLWGAMGAFGTNGGGMADMLGSIVRAAPFLVVGFFAHRAHRWAFITGMFLITWLLVEALLIRSVIGVAIRAWALWEVFQAFQIACAIQRQLRGGR